MPEEGSLQVAPWRTEGLRAGGFDPELAQGHSLFGLFMGTGTSLDAGFLQGTRRESDLWGRSISYVDPG
jgi:hypothetical protein